MWIRLIYHQENVGCIYQMQSPGIAEDDVFEEEVGHYTNLPNRNLKLVISKTLAWMWW